MLILQFYLPARKGLNNFFSMNKTLDELKKMPKEEVLNFIRQKLAFDENYISQLRYIVRNSDCEDWQKEHRRFEMSGYEGEVGFCTTHNLAILNEFAYLGIYDYTKYLFLDFYKGSCTLYLQYCGEYENLEFDFSGYGTTEIIFEIFEKTIFSNKQTRRR